MTKDEFRQELEKLNIYLTEEQYKKLEQFYELLIDWNKKINLTRIVEKEEVYLKHFYDSLTITKVIDLSTIKTLCDVGTGAGFPGIVLKICYPDLEITLIDARNKRVLYLNEIIKTLNLKKIKVIHIRGEEYKEQFDCVVARAVANIEKLVKYTMHLVKENGMFIAMKGDISTEFSKNIRKIIEREYKIEKTEIFLLPKENSKRSLIVLKNTPKKEKSN